jgi:hypothetical protein
LYYIYDTRTVVDTVDLDAVLPLLTLHNLLGDELLLLLID